MAPGALHALTERLLDTARERFLRDGAHEGIAYLLVRGGHTSIAVTLAAAEDRAVVRRIFEAAAREGAEAWGLGAEGGRGGAGEPRLTPEAEFEEFIGFRKIQALAARHGIE